MRNLLFLLFCLLLSTFSAYSQDLKVEPPNWWTGMKNTTLQLLLHGEDIGNFNLVIQNNNVKLIASHQAESKNYLFLDLDISNAEPGTFEIILNHNEKESIAIDYELKERSQNSSAFKGFDASDVIYLITPDRFANGDTTNDKFDDLNEKTINRSDDYGRHGGDIRGIINHLDYIDDMGYTAIWSSPLLINDMKRSSYHGYAITDFYKVDPRFGTLEEYIELAERAENRGLKLIMDMVANHCGSEHWWMKDLPFKDWVNYSDNYKVTNHVRTANMDPYATKADRDLLSKGWFVSSMPDLNQQNPFMAAYIIQNNIWWIETLKLGGIRQDTYPYPDKNFMSEWAKSIMTEYPDFNIVGEEWSYNPLLIGYWLDGANNKDGYRSYLKSSMDFAMQRIIVEGLLEDESWGKGLIKIYEGLANDFHYADPQSIMIFPDNHDMDRIFTQLKEDFALTKMAMALYLTYPRIPQVYYGTEILMQNSAKPGDHGLIRTDFPGGWEDDHINGFTGVGLTEDQMQMQEFMRKLLNFRKTSSAIHSGKTIHYAPSNGLYIFSRYDGDQKVIVIINKKDSDAIISSEKYEEIFGETTEATDIISGEKISISESINVGPKSVTILAIQ